MSQSPENLERKDTPETTSIPMKEKSDKNEAHFGKGDRGGHPLKSYELCKVIYGEDNRMENP